MHSASVVAALVAAVLSGLAPGPVVAAGARAADPSAPPVAVRPVPGAVLRGFEPPAHPFGPGHRGVALAAAPGEAVRAALAGTVRFSGEVARRGWVTVEHGGGLATTYGWLEPRAVTAGERVGAGEVLGRLDGEATHLHWGARLHGRYIDPLSLLGGWTVRLVPWGERPAAAGRGGGTAALHGGRARVYASRRGPGLPGPLAVSAEAGTDIAASPRGQRSPPTERSRGGPVPPPAHTGTRSPATTAGGAGRRVGPVARGPTATS